jgi:hypothetical protein
MITLENVIDTRTGNFHSVAIVKDENKRFFVPVIQQDKKIKKGDKKGDKK